MMKRAYIVCCLLALSLAGCENDIYRSSIPDVSVHLELNLVSQYPLFANSYNEYIIFSEPRYAVDRVGFGGVIVYTTLEGKYVAFDLACPVEAKRDVRVEPDDAGVLTCAVCGERYDITFGLGYPMEGISKEPLKRYVTSLYGNTLIVSLK
ncbi:MAG TPA: hypothetical protein DEO38_02330 [Bacteroidales bacterium]|jgi:hypothetical protein|nr:hypothetical protein [Bacteroidales bacterium]